MKPNPFRFIGFEPTEISPNPSEAEIALLKRCMLDAFKAHGLSQFYGVIVEYGATFTADQPSQHPDHAPLRAAVAAGWSAFRAQQARSA